MNDKLISTFKGDFLFFLVLCVNTLEKRIFLPLQNLHKILYTANYS